MRYILLYVLLIGVIALRPACDSATPGTTPPEVTVGLDAGECVEIEDQKERGTIPPALVALCAPTESGALPLRVRRLSGTGGGGSRGF